MNTTSKPNPDSKDDFFPLERLINGLVHNINNPLTIIKVRSQLLLSKYPQNQALKTILENVSRLENILGNLATKINEEHNPAVRLLSLNKLIQVELNYLLGDMYFKHHVTREVYLEDNLPLVSGVYRYVSQGFLAIVAACLLNMREAPSKTLRVRTFKVGEQCLLEISDTGNLLTADDLVQLNYALHGQIELPAFDEGKTPAIHALVAAAKMLSDFSNDFVTNTLSSAGLVCQVTFKHHPRSTR